MNRTIKKSIAAIGFLVVFIAGSLFDCLSNPVTPIQEELETRGIILEGSFTLDMTQNFQGGASTNGSALRNLLDLGIHLDLEKLIRIEDTNVFVGFQNVNGDNATENEIGDVQSISNIDADGRTQISEFWIEKEFHDNLFRLKIGKIDANSEFGYVENGAEFIHSSPGFSPTIIGFPSYPDPATSANLFIFPGQFYGGLGIYDGALQEGVFTGKLGPKTFFDDPADLFLIGEAGFHWQLGEDDLYPGRLGLGIWQHTGDFLEFNGDVESRTAGFYVVCDQTLDLQDKEHQIDREAQIFFQFAYADEDVSELDFHFGGGLTLKSPFSHRVKDAIGVAGSYVHFSNAAKFLEDFEFAVEIFYKIQMNELISFKPDLQFIVNPGGENLRDAVVGTIRIETIF